MGTRSHTAVLLLALAFSALAPSLARADDDRKDHVYVWGEVKNPGAFPWKKGLTVPEVIRLAGGFTEAAHRNRATLTRGKREITLTADDLTPASERDAIKLERGDVLRIERGALRVEGEVRSPGDYGLEHGTVRQALIAAGGPTPAADLDTVYIARGGKVIRVDARALLTGGPAAENPTLEPGDVLHVPRSHSRVTIAGEVNRPGAYDLEPGKLERLEDLIAIAGGPTAKAQVARIELRRATRAGERPQVETINLEDPTQDELQRNPVLQSGDYVVVPAQRRGRSMGINEVYQIGVLILTLVSILMGR